MCDDCIMRTWDIKAAKQFAAGVLQDASRIKDYVPSTPTASLINLAKAFLGKRT